MTITYRIDHERELIFESWSGSVDASELGAYWKRILAEPEVLALRRTIVDLRSAELVFRGDELRALVNSIVVPALAGKRWVTALVVGAPVQFGVSNQYSAFADSYSRDEVFENIDDAVRWALAQPLPT